MDVDFKVYKSINFNYNIDKILILESTLTSISVGA